MERAYPVDRDRKAKGHGGHMFSEPRQQDVSGRWPGDGMRRSCLDKAPCWDARRPLGQGGAPSMFLLHGALSQAQSARSLQARPHRLASAASEFSVSERRRVTLWPGEQRRGFTSENTKNGTRGPEVCPRGRRSATGVTASKRLLTLCSPLSNSLAS